MSYNNTKTRLRRVFEKYGVLEGAEDMAELYWPGAPVRYRLTAFSSSGTALLDVNVIRSTLRIALRELDRESAWYYFVLDTTGVAGPIITLVPSDLEI